MTAEEFDRRFDDGENISDFLDWDSARRPGLEQRRVNVDLPSWMISELDKQASLIGVTRQSIIKVWLSERIKSEKSEKVDGPNAYPHHATSC
ncbi:MAG: BrnA antitoxin family protein [Verrucomicrobia bacterium]|nr:BrnA antitoxin family protein [Verrucomicrobiota bacterium]